MQGEARVSDVDDLRRRRLGDLAWAFDAPTFRDCLVDYDGQRVQARLVDGTVLTGLVGCVGADWVSLAPDEGVGGEIQLRVSSLIAIGPAP